MTKNTKNALGLKTPKLQTRADIDAARSFARGLLALATKAETSLHRRLEAARGIRTVKVQNLKVGHVLSRSGRHFKVQELVQMQRPSAKRQNIVRIVTPQKIFVMYRTDTVKVRL